MREMIGRVLATQEAHGREICLVRKDLKELGNQVAQHRVGWRVFIGLGSLAIGICLAFVGYWKA